MTTIDQAHRALGFLVGATPGPWNDDVVDVWISQFSKVSDGDVLIGVCERLAREWTDRYRPSLGEVLAAHDAMIQNRTRRALPSAVHCDGSGWVAQTVGRFPCRRCNPALAEVFDDEESLDRWRHGTPLWLLDVGVERRRDGSLRHRDGPPPICTPAHDDGGLLRVEPRIGIAVAREAYEAECRAASREPNVERFERVVRADVIGPGSPRPR